MAITRSLIEFHHDTGYMDHLLDHINHAIRGKDMRAISVIVGEDFHPTDVIPDGYHPIQKSIRRGQSFCSTKITLLAYEVYKEVYGKQESLITGSCRGGFGIMELVAFLYARSFPKNEWRQRVDEAFNGMRNC